jgi:hypothetical protein
MTILSTMMRTEGIEVMALYHIVNGYIRMCMFNSDFAILVYDVLF